MILLWVILITCGGLSSCQDYLGCYKAPAGDNDAFSALNRASAPTECIEECKRHYYMYAGLMSGQQCYCLSGYGRDGPSNGCTIPCATEPSSFCGSHDAISIYATNQRGPSPPRHLQVTKTASSSLHITWEPPNIPNGNVTSYVIRVNPVKTHSPRLLLPTQSQVQGGSSDSTILTGLHPGSTYNISMTALNPEGESDPISILEETALGPPNPPETPKILDRTASTITLELSKGSSENGPLTAYQILVVYPGTIPPARPNESFPNYSQAIRDNTPYYVTAEFEASDFAKNQKFVVGDGRKINSYYNAPLEKPFDAPQIGLVAVSRTRTASLYSYSGLTENMMNASRNGGNGIAVFLWVAIVFLSLLLAASIFVYLVLRRRYAGRMGKLPEQQELTLQGPMYEVDNMAYIPEDVPERPNHYQDLKKKVWSIPKNFLNVDYQLVVKRGRFGTIYKGTVQDKNGVLSEAVIHCISDVNLRPSEKKHMLRDLDVCIKTGSMKYLAGFVGNCETPETLYIVLEATPDTLKNRLLAARVGQVFPYEQILPIGSGIAQGLAYLEAHKVIHSHLCARSIGLTSDYVPKIGGFGIGKHSIEDVKLARWTAPERFGHKKHIGGVVWAFGVVVWEMMSMGGTPYSDLEDECDVEAAVVEQDVRLPQLRDMPDPLYEVLVSCWMVDPEERPIFDELARLNTLSICPITAITEPYLAELELN
ncbi:putative tyrosine-protein kinase Wsck [Diachasma alloeum]|uniref:putative tyrosine-protein kinase Wsck n=1 Tax=Diachasma alloeum TaxID=454923 RepID=UPI00073845CA|nr:putative tyrosine-protein kinase Wsck [Diachasma alloeum]